MRVAMTMAAMFGGLLLASCGAPCRDIEVRPLELQCSPTSSFTGELHFDSAATFDTFLRQQCLLGDDSPAADAALQSVDFDTEGVFLAAGPHALRQRCLSARELGSVQVCSTGLKVYFHDEYRAEGGNCPGTRWTVAFALPREELRAALEAGGSL